VTTWFTADLHFGHTNIIKYCDRPYTDAVEMNAALVDSWNKAVGTNDDVWVLGDFALGTIADTLPLAAQLNGTKTLVAGNHDRCWIGYGDKGADWVARYLDAGFDGVIRDATTIDVGGIEVSACHFPYRGDSHDEDRFVDHRPVDDGQWLLHGHVHHQWTHQNRMINVGVDVWDQQPVSEATLADIMKQAN